MDEENTAARLESLLRLYRVLHDEVVRLDGVLTLWGRASQDAHRLITIPGMGWVLAAVVLSQIGDIKRFSSSKKLCAYAGLVPRVRQSGKTRRTGAVSLSGRSILRHALHTVVLHAGRRSGVVGSFYERLAVSRPKALARVAAMRKLLTVIWHMLASGQPYRGKDDGLTARKLKQHSSRNRATAKISSRRRKGAPAHPSALET